MQNDQRSKTLFINISTKFSCRTRRQLVSTQAQKKSDFDGIKRGENAKNQVQKIEGQIDKISSQYRNQYINPLYDHWLYKVPHVRFRFNKDRQKEQILDLAVLNERLNGRQPWQIQIRAEYLRQRIKNWELVYDYVMANDVFTTLESIEIANNKVQQTLDEQYKERTSISDLRSQLLHLQKEVNIAHEKLHHTEERLSDSLFKIITLSNEADKFNDSVHGDDDIVDSNMQRVDRDNMEKVYNADINQELQGAKSQEAVHAYLLEADFYPIMLSQDLQKEQLKPIELFNENWVLFRNQSNEVCMLKDECAHRACPLSIGKVKNGCVQCPYHGWEYNKQGQCTVMPSTIYKKNIFVDKFNALESDNTIYISQKLIKDISIPDLQSSNSEFNKCIIKQVDIEYNIIIDLLAQTLQQSHSIMYECFMGKLLQGIVYIQGYKDVMNIQPIKLKQPYTVQQTMNLEIQKIDQQQVNENGLIGDSSLGTSQNQNYHLSWSFTVLPIENNQSSLIFCKLNQTGQNQKQVQDQVTLRIVKYWMEQVVNNVLLKLSTNQNGLQENQSL